jgi:hypothetical protein
MAIGPAWSGFVIRKEKDMAGRDAWLNEMLVVLAEDLEENAQEYREIARTMAREGEDPERLYQWFLAGFKKMAAEVRA